MNAPTEYRVALYARVSTHNGQDPEMQLRELREYCQRRNWQIAEEYIDCGISGSQDSRPALNRLMADGCRDVVDASTGHLFGNWIGSDDPSDIW
jgi:predicted site-specific integrase-resolvase